MATVTTPSGNSTLPVAGGDMVAEPINGWITQLRAFLDEAGNIDEANVDLSGTDGIVGKSTAQTIVGLKTFENQSVAAGGVRTALQIAHNPASGTATDGDGVEILFRGDDDGGTATTFAELEVVFTDTGASSEDARYDLKALVAASAQTLISIGGLDTHVDIANPARTHTAATNAYNLYVRSGGAQTIPAGTTALVAGLRVDEPNITATGTVTNAATVYVADAPTEGGTGNFALWVDAGTTRLDGQLTLTGTWQAPILIGGIYLWDDTTADCLRVSRTAPGSISDGTILVEG